MKNKAELNKYLIDTHEQFIQFCKINGVGSPMLIEGEHYLLNLLKADAERMDNND